MAQTTSEIVGFIHYIVHEDIIDGGPNSLISALFVSQRFRGKGVGSLLLDGAISDSLARGAVGAEASTIHAHAREFYKKRRFKQTFGDIGEIFLELDIAEYLRAKQNVGV